jgi:hypothetical protein
LVDSAIEQRRIRLAAYTQWFDYFGVLNLGQGKPLSYFIRINPGLLIQCVSLYVFLKLNFLRLPPSLPALA